jgi:hypothetical protein
MNEILQTKWLDGQIKCENVLRQLQIIHIQHTYVISTQKNLKTEFFGPTLLRHFLFKTSDFLEIFKSILRGF